MATERNTMQKQTIYDALVTLGHPSATEIYEYVHAAHPTISRGTVFRVLGGFARSGRARKLHFGESDDRFDATLAPHSHAICRKCGRIADVFLPEALQLSPGETDDGFYLERYEVEMFGLCKACREKKPYSETEKGEK